MTNVVPLRPLEGLNPTQMIDRLHALAEQLRQIKIETVRLEALLESGPHAKKEGLVASHAAGKSVDLVSSAADVLLDAVAELIVEAAAQRIVTTSAQ